MFTKEGGNCTTELQQRVERARSHSRLHRHLNPLLGPATPPGKRLNSPRRPASDRHCSLCHGAVGRNERGLYLRPPRSPKRGGKPRSYTTLLQSEW